MPYPNEHAARVIDPGEFIPDSFRSKELKNGIRIIVAKLKGGTSMIVQAYRFSVNNFTVEQAKKWLEDNKVKYIKFESAQVESGIGGSMNYNQLKHVGIMGMRWGQRRAESAARATARDAASLREHGFTKEAAAVQKVSDSIVRKKSDMPGESGGKKTRNLSEDHKVAAAIKAKHLSEISNADIEKLATRLQLEKRYKDLNPNKVAKGKKGVDSVFSGIGKVSAVAASIVALAAVGKPLLLKVFKAVKKT